MKRFYSNHRASLGFVAGALLASAIGVAGAFTSPQDHPQDHPAQSGAEQSLRVATYEPESAFQQYYRAEEFNQKMGEIDQQMREAQQQGDQQKLMELQNRMQQMRQEVIENFYDDMEKAAPEVAKNSGVKVIAVDVLYTAREVEEPRDLTSHLIRHVNRQGEGNAPRERPTPPGQPQRGPGR